MPKDKSSIDTPAPVSNTKIIYRRKREEIFGVDSGTLQWIGTGLAIALGLGALLKKNEQQLPPQPQNPPEQQLPENQQEPAISYQTQTQTQQDTPQSQQPQQPADFTTESVRKEVVNRYKGAGNQPVFAKRMSIA